MIPKSMNVDIYSLLFIIGLFLIPCAAIFLYEKYKAHKQLKENAEALALKLVNLRNRIKEITEFKDSEEILSEAGEVINPEVLERGAVEIDQKVEIVRDEEGNMRLGIRKGWEHLNADDVALIHHLERNSKLQKEKIEELEADVKRLKKEIEKK